MSEHYHSQIDERHGLPGDERLRLTMLAAKEFVAATSQDGNAPLAWNSETWQRIAALDSEAGFGTRFAARVLLCRSDDRFLIFKYPFRDGSRRWVIPGGGAEPGEDAQAAATREVEEETGTAPFELRFTGIVLTHILASTVQRERPVIQYSPLFRGRIADELPDTGGRATHWHSLEEFRNLPRRPISEPIMQALARNDNPSESLTAAVFWLPA